MVCLRCGKVDEFNEDLLDSLEDRIFQQRGFKVLDHELKLYGICKNCAKNARSRG
ncbi:MAG: transcriptional repressor [Sulfobacillus sp.]